MRIHPNGTPAQRRPGNPDHHTPRAARRRPPPGALCCSPILKPESAMKLSARNQIKGTVVEVTKSP